MEQKTLHMWLSEFMNKKGFTLIEIIICISLIVIIGMGSIFAVNLISNKRLISKLEQITDRAVNAAQVYIGTNDATYTELYNNKNGISLPLQLLVEEGLLNLDNTELTKEDIKNQYVITFLGSNNPNNVCEQITSTTSWGNDKEIYLCLNANDITVSLEETNYEIITKEKYIFKGEDPDNYIKYEGKTYRIMSVEIDDSLILVSKDSFGTVFGDNIHKIKYYKRASYERINNVAGNDCEGISCIVMRGEQDISKSEVLLTLKDIAETAETTKKVIANYSNYDILNTYINDLIGTDAVAVYGYSGTSYRSWNYPETIQGYKIHIKNCFRITNGIGTDVEPYILENKC